MIGVHTAAKKSTTSAVDAPEPNCPCCGSSGIQAAYVVKRFEEGKSHHQARSKLQEAETIIAQKDAEIEKLNAQVSLRTPPCATAPCGLLV